MLIRRENMTGRRAELSATVGRNSLFVKEIFEKYGQGEKYIFDPVSFVYLLPNKSEEESEKEAPKEERAREYVLREKETVNLVTRSERSREFITKVLERASMPGPRELLYRRSWKEQLINKVSVILQDCRSFEEAFFREITGDLAENTQGLHDKNLFHWELRTLEQNLEKWKTANPLNEEQYQKQTAQSVSRLLTQRKLLEQREEYQLLMHFRKLIMRQMQEDWQDTDLISQRVHFIREQMDEVFEQNSIPADSQVQSVMQQVRILAAILRESDIFTLTRRFEEGEWQELPGLSENWSPHQICQLQWMLVDKMHPAEWKRAKEKLDASKKLDELSLNYPEGAELLHLIEEWVQDAEERGVSELISVTPADKGFEVIRLLQDRVQHLTMGRISFDEMKEDSINALLLQQFGLESLVNRIEQTEWNDFQDKIRELPTQDQVLEAERFLLYHISFEELEQAQFVYLPQPVQNKMQSVLEQMREQRAAEYVDDHFDRLFVPRPSDGNLEGNSEKELWPGILREFGITTLVKRMDRQEWDQLKVYLEDWDSSSQDFLQIQQLLLNKLSPVERERVEHSALGMKGHPGYKTYGRTEVNDFSLEYVAKADQGKVIRNLQNIRIIDQLSRLAVSNPDTEEMVQGSLKEAIQGVFWGENQEVFTKRLQETQGEESQEVLIKTLQRTLGEESQEVLIKALQRTLGEESQEVLIKALQRTLGEENQEILAKVLHRTLGEENQEVLANMLQRTLGEENQEVFAKALQRTLGEGNQEVLTKVLQETLEEENQEIFIKAFQRTLRGENQEVLTKALQGISGEENRELLTKVLQRTLREEDQGDFTEAVQRIFREIKQGISEETIQENLEGILQAAAQETIQNSVWDIKYDVREIVDGIQLILQESTAGLTQEQQESLVERYANVLERMDRRMLSGSLVSGDNTISRDALQLLRSQEYPLWQEAFREGRRYDAVDVSGQSVEAVSFWMDERERNPQSAIDLAGLVGRGEELLSAEYEPIPERMSRTLEAQVNRALEAVEGIPHLENKRELRQMPAETKASPGRLQFFQANSRMIQQQQAVQQEQLNQLKEQTLQQSEVIREMEKQQKVLIEQLEEPQESPEEVEKRIIRRLQEQLRMERMRRGLV